ncbi:MAG: hypothetical protein ACJ0BU_10185 [Candidatus Puniceispirillales bacterium]
MLESFKRRDLGFEGYISILIFILFVGMLAFKARNDQWNVWKANPDLTFYNGSPLLSTADGPYFVGIAQSLSENKSVSSFNERRYFPNFNKELGVQKKLNDFEEPGFFDISLLPRIISYFSKFYNNDLLLTSNLLIPISAFITAVLISFFFLVLGFGYEGVIAGLGASLSQSIYVRTSIGRVDTDLLNIGFFYSVLAFLSASVITNKFRDKILLIILTGFSNFCFVWWYQMPGFFIPFLITLILLQFLYKTKFKVSIIQIILFSLFSGPFFVFESFQNIVQSSSAYISFFSDSMPKTSLIFPDTFNTITELQNLKFSEYSKLIFGPSRELIMFLGILGLVIFLLFNLKVSVAILPAFIFLLMSIFLGKRFAIYAIPLYWFGVAYLIFSLAILTNKMFKLSNYINIKDRLLNNFVISLSTLAFIFFIVTTSISYCENDGFFNCKPKYTPMPSFSTKITEAFSSFNNDNFDNSSIVVTWWDFGYWLNYFSGLSSVHDGGSQRSPKTYLVAKSLTSTEQQKSYNMINYLVSSDSQKIITDSNKSYEFFNKQISNSKNINRPVYLFLSKEMIGWWSTITYLGNWDIVNGKEKDKTIFERIDCKPKSSVEMLCGNAILNINSGSISNGNQLDSLVITRNGSQIRRYDYKNKRGEVSLLIDIVKKNRSFYVVSPETLDSTFSKLFLLNLPENEFFSLIKDEYPFYRIFKIN